MSEILATRGIQGVIVASHLPEKDVPLVFDWEKFSGVKIDYYPHEPSLHMVTNDHRAIVRLIMRQARAAGYRRMGFVIPRWWDDFADRAWSAGFLAEQQLLAPEDWVPILFFSEPAAGQAASPDTRGMVVPLAELQDWLRRHRPEVVISSEPFVRSRLEELEIAVPRDLAIVEIYSNLDPAIAGVRHNCDRVGELAVEILVGQLQQNTFGIPAFPTATLVAGSWCEGESLPRLKSPHA